MLKYLCLIALVASIYGAPVDDAVTSHNINTHTIGNQVVPDVVVQNTVTSHVVDEHVQDDDHKKSTSPQTKVVEILESGSEHQTDGTYSFHYRGADGTFREETAVVKNPGTDNEYLEINGAYSFFDVDGKEVVVHYKADHKGFVPVGNNIPDAISTAARENSQLPPLKKNNGRDEDDDDVEENNENVLKKKVNN